MSVLVYFFYFIIASFFALIPTVGEFALDTFRDFLGDPFLDGLEGELCLNVTGWVLAVLMLMIADDPFDSFNMIYLFVGLLLFLKRISLSY